MTKQAHVLPWQTLQYTARAAQVWGYTNLASGILTRAANEARRALGPLDLTYARFLMDAAEIYGAGQRNREAEASLREALGIYKEHFGDEHPSVGLLMHELAECLKTQGEIEKADECTRLSRRILSQIKAS